MQHIDEGLTGPSHRLTRSLPGWFGPCSARALAPALALQSACGQFVLWGRGGGGGGAASPWVWRKQSGCSSEREKGMLRLGWAFVLGTSRGGIRQNRTRDVAVLGDVSHTSLMLRISSTGRHLF